MWDDLFSNCFLVEHFWPNNNGGVTIEKGSLSHSTELARIMNVHLGHEVSSSSFVYRTPR